MEEKMEVEKKYITVEELKLHNKPGDLWISIQGKIYNVSDWVNDHPGGDTILYNLGGQDVTDGFMAYHPSTVWKRLGKYFNGFHLKDFEISEASKDYRKLHAEISQMGLFENKGHGALYHVTTIVVLLYLVVYGVLKSDSVLVHFVCAIMLGILWIMGAYMGHDSGHYQVMSNRKCNQIGQLLAGNCLTGISIAWWKWTHNAHHIACNSLDYDPDLQHLPVFAVSTKFFHSITSVFYGRKLDFDHVARFLVSHQHFTYYPIMIVGRVNLFIQTFLLLLSKRSIPNRTMNIMGILVFWTWFPLLVMCLPTWSERVMFVLVSFAVTALQHIQFTLNHFSGDTYLGPPTGNDWFEKQTAGTIDISCSKYMDWFFGGLQFQLEHHLFPRLPRCQLRTVSPVVKELCKKHNLPHRSLSFWDANVTTLRVLRTAALQAWDMTLPVPKNLAWEAVNTHG